MTSRMRSGGERSRTLFTVRSSTDHASLWKMMTTDVSGSSDTGGYGMERHLAESS